MNNKFVAMISYEIIDDGTYNEKTDIYKVTWYGLKKINHLNFNIYKTSKPHPNLIS